jgi:hypothetical protein
LSDGLERVEWGRLGHAYGSAEDVPGQIRDLTSSSRKRRERALYELFGNIHHQGTVYSATAPAVPFLAEVLRSEDTDARVRVELAWLLEAIAGGSSYLDAHRSLIEADGERIDEDALSEELRWVQAARDAVGLELPSLAPLIGAAREELSLSVAALAAHYPELSEHSLPLVRRVYQDATTPGAQRLLALVQLLLGDRSEPLLDDVRSAPEEDVDPEVLAEGVAELERGQIPEHALMLLEDLTGAALRGWDES